jgi:hypothetical protein
VTRLDGSFAKLDRADEHISGLHQAIQVWSGKQPYSLTEHDNPEKTERVYRLKIDQPPEALRWGVQVGDAIHNLRSALDLLAWQAAGGDGTAPSWTEFPIFKDETIYLNTGRGGGLNKISGVKDPGYRTLFKECQPWRNPDGHDKDALWMLHELDRIDKHRVVTPILTVPLRAAGQVLVTYQSKEAAENATPPIFSSPPQAPLEDGAEVVRVRTASPFVEMEMNTQTTLGVSLEYGDRPYRGGVSFLLSKMAKRARGIVEQFRDAGL